MTRCFAPRLSATCDGGLGQLGRPQIRGRRVDQVARQTHRAGEPLDEAAIGPLRPYQLGPAALLLFLAVAIEGVGAERPAERRPARVAAFRQGLDAVSCPAAGSPTSPAKAHIAASPSGTPTSTRPSRPSAIGQQRQLAGLAGKPGRRRPVALGRPRRSRATPPAPICPPPRAAPRPSCRRQRKRHCRCPEIGRRYPRGAPIIMGSPAIRRQADWRLVSPYTNRRCP